jgi:hypothetical protein
MILQLCDRNAAVAEFGTRGLVELVVIEEFVDGAELLAVVVEGDVG